MNPIQIAIIAFIVIVILLTLGYYWYDDIRFKKKVEDKFNQSTRDVLVEENKVAVLDSVDSEQEQEVQIMRKDIAPSAKLAKDPLLDDVVVEPSTINDPHTTAKAKNNQHELLQEEPNLFNIAREENAHPDTDADVPEDSVEAFFVKLDKVNFPFVKDIDNNFDLIIDIVFEEAKKIKILPEIAQFTHKYFVFYVLDKDDVWQMVEKGKKYTAKALKLVVQLVDQDGVISQAQIENIYNELHKFVINNDAHIRCSDYEASLQHIQEQIKLLANIELVLELYLLTKDHHSYAAISKFFNNNGLVDHDGRFDLIESGHSLFVISNEKQLPLKPNEENNLLSIVAKLHLYDKPLYIVDKIFDLAEKFMQEFESRILTTNKQVVGQREYDQLYNHVKNYIDSAHKKQISLGGTLIHRLFN